MAEFTAWLLDVYPDPQQGAVVWMLEDGGARRRLHQPFPVTFYASGPFGRLRAAWRYLQAQPIPVDLARAERADLFQGPIPVLAVTVPNPCAQQTLFQQLARFAPDLDYYDADLPFSLRYLASQGAFPLARCRVQVEGTETLRRLTVLDSPWDLYPENPALRVLTAWPNCDPAHSPPTALELGCGRATYRLPLEPGRPLIVGLQAILTRHDPDLILTHWGDTWLFPYLLDLAEKLGLEFNPNRDPRRTVLTRQERSYFTYGQIVYRGRQVQLFGRWHIDARNAMMFGDYGLEGVLEQARVTGLPVQEVARKSPGAGITAMQMLTALRRGVLVPYQKQQVEAFKSAAELLRSDQGGLVYQPLVGLHRDVAAVDFFSMYPQIMAHFNISPETVIGSAGAALPITDRNRTGLVPETLAPLLKKRYALKEQLLTLNPHDCRYKPYKARVAALKWLLVVCFGYLGYKNARFGRIEAHEAVTAYGREVLLRAKEAAEDLGFTVLHLYVDCLFVRKPGAARVEDFQPLLDEILARTGLPISLDGVFRWVAFLPSRVNARVPVANRYFGVFQDGSLKARGIELRRGDTCPFVSETQAEILARLARVPNADALPQALPAVGALVRRRLDELRAGSVPLEKLLVMQKLSRSLEEYRAPSPAARAAGQLRAVGKELRPGQHVRFWYTLGEPGVWARDLPASPVPGQIHRQRYRELLLRAVGTVLQPLGIAEESLPARLSAHAAPLFLFSPALTSSRVKRSGRG